MTLWWKLCEIQISVSLNKLLQAPSRAHLFTYCLRLLRCHNGQVEKPRQGPTACKAWSRCFCALNRKSLRITVPDERNQSPIVSLPTAGDSFSRSWFHSSSQGLTGMSRAAASPQEWGDAAGQATRAGGARGSWVPVSGLLPHPLQAPGQVPSTGAVLPTDKTCSHPST